MRTLRARFGRAAVLTGSVLLGASLMAACGSGGQRDNAAGNSPQQVPSTSSAASTSAPTTSPDSTSTGSPTSESPTSGSPTSGQVTNAAPAAPAECKAGTLDVTLVNGDGAAGTVYRYLKFTNTGAAKCVIQGYPGVSYVTGDDGRQVGQAAKRIPPKGPPITLSTGESASVEVGFVNVGNFDPADCKPTPTRGLRIYPPHDTAAMFVPFKGTGCAGSTPDPQLTVKTAGQGPGAS